MTFTLHARIHYRSLRILSPLLLTRVSSCQPQWGRDRGNILVSRITPKQQRFVTEYLIDLNATQAAIRAGYMERNTARYVREVTSIALRAASERLRIETLTLLDGVSWPTASVILHFFHRSRYPILDFRALWSVRLETPSQYGFEFWWSYVRYCRVVASEHHVDMRTLDRALWQYSKERPR